MGVAANYSLMPWRLTKRYPASAILIEDTVNGVVLIDDASEDL